MHWVQYMYTFVKTTAQMHKQHIRGKVLRRPPVPAIGAELTGKRNIYYQVVVLFKVEDRSK